MPLSIEQRGQHLLNRLSFSNRPLNRLSGLGRATGEAWRLLKITKGTGFSSPTQGQIQAISYWHLGVTYRSGADQARGVGFFKFVPSAGWCKTKDEAPWGS